jgi:hypothetical protein
MSQSASASAQDGTKAQAFIAKKGALVMKEFHPIAKVKSDYIGEMEIETLVFSMLQGRQIDRTFGVKVTTATYSNSYREEYTSLIDLDELAELIDGLRYLRQKQEQLLAGSISDYTELNYTTNGSFRVGFYLQSKQGETTTGVFASCQGGGSQSFSQEAIGTIAEAMERAKGYLEHLSGHGGSEQSYPPPPPPPTLPSQL